MANEFSTPIDIANRALQHLGARRIDPNLGFTENSKNASEIAASYDKLRAAELRRNTWRFAIRRAVLRPVNALAISGQPFTVATTTPATPIAPTMLVLPALWQPLATYSLGSLVSDTSGSLWINVVPASTDQEGPGYSAHWEQYFGPVTADSYISSTAYSAGELCYTFPGNGLYTVFQSLMNGNQAPPAVAMPWLSNTVYAEDETAIVYPAWDPLVTYAAGPAVLYTDGNVYASLANGNLNNPPPANPSLWAVFPTTTDANGNTISAITEWSPVVTYTLGAIVDLGGVLYVLPFASASGQGTIPSGGQGGWRAITGGALYQSLVDLNQGNAPASSPTQWTTSTAVTSGTGSPQWRTLGVALQQLGIVYPLGSGPTTQSATRNAFRLPANFLRRAPRDPKAGSMSWLGAPTGMFYDDWNFEGDYIVSREFGPITLRFVGDVTQVTKMDPMFCEGLAARIAYEVAEPLTQSKQKKDDAGTAYKAFMSEARLMNSIEVGADEPPLDDYIACRV